MGSGLVPSEAVEEENRLPSLHRLPWPKALALAGHRQAALAPERGRENGDANDLPFPGDEVLMPRRRPATRTGEPRRGGAPHEGFAIPCEGADKSVKIFGCQATFPHERQSPRLSGSKPQNSAIGFFSCEPQHFCPSCRRSPRLGSMR
jgi:hypothetical protein